MTPNRPAATPVVEPIGRALLALRRQRSAGRATIRPTTAADDRQRGQSRLGTAAPSRTERNEARGHDQRPEGHRPDDPGRDPDRHPHTGECARGQGRNSSETVRPAGTPATVGQLGWHGSCRSARRFAASRRSIRSRSRRRRDPLRVLGDVTSTGSSVSSTVSNGPAVVRRASLTQLVPAGSTRAVHRSRR